MELERLHDYMQYQKNLENIDSWFLNNIDVATPNFNTCF
jgi:hypothetical protein